MEEVQSQLDEDEIVLAKDYQVEVGTSFDVKTDFTGLEIKDAAKVKITFEEAKSRERILQHPMQIPIKLFIR